MENNENQQTYFFTIEESLSTLVKVRADNEDEAYNKIKQAYLQEKIVLDSSNCTSYEIENVTEEYELDPSYDCEEIK